MSDSDEPKAILPHKPVKRVNKKVVRALLLAVPFICIVVVALGLVYRNKRQATGSQAALVCGANADDEFLEQTAVLLRPEQSERLALQIDRIKDLEGLDKDPNCLNIMATYYLNIADYSRAKIYMDLLEKAYDPNVGFSDRLGVSAMSMDELRARLEIIRKATDGETPEDIAPTLGHTG